MAKRTGKKLNVKKTIITLAAVYVICHLVYGSTSIVDLKMQQNQLAQELDAAYTVQTELQAELEYMSSEDAVEKIAREKLGLVKDGEILIRHVDTSQAQ
ncbi:MAG: septum formation initiator family protein [Peptococcaceae bacterium]|nr:septum formation initiator family protein [Peptococcaceae bacterium]